MSHVTISCTTIIEFPATSRALFRAKTWSWTFSDQIWYKSGGWFHSLCIWDLLQTYYGAVHLDTATFVQWLCSGKIGLRKNFEKFSMYVGLFFTIYYNTIGFITSKLQIECLLPPNLKRTYHWQLKLLLPDAQEFQKYPRPT
jgi:hypothetical protein